MNNPSDLYQSILKVGNTVSISELLAAHPVLTRRTVQRWLSILLSERKIIVVGEGRGRRYQVLQRDEQEYDTDKEAFPSFIPLAADSWDVLAYIDQPVECRNPVGYQRDFLDAYQPNQTGV
ncbi:hypothetical protein ACH42_10990 [Endozoicomonas sp. (ex Bugula neritina AB1)]|nr:hypothetical protein ACH42_10990 [Endozoicomonas sp. (ex Bugula neritina AB1)]